MPKADDDGNAQASDRAVVKCVVWDLDETLWRGTLLEGGANALAPGIEEIVRTLDSRGILQSIASKNDHDIAWAQLKSLGIAEFFLFPQIGWWSKTKSIENIAERLGIGLDSLAFIDDQIVEREEVAYYLPQVFLVAANDLSGLLDEPRLMPRFVTNESCKRRSMYMTDIERKGAEERFDGKRDAFLASLAMRMTIRRATTSDLERAEELTVRTNQLNTTAQTYSHAELSYLIDAPDHLVLVAQLDDRYGSSGIIGLALVERKPEVWTLRLLIMSCRVVSRGVGSVFLAHLLQRAQQSGVKLRAAYVPTPRNKQMLVTLRFAGFRPFNGDGLTLEHDLTRLPTVPSYVEVVSDECPIKSA